MGTAAAAVARPNGRGGLCRQLQRKRREAHGNGTVLVGADGANSLVRRTFFQKKQIRSYLSIQQWFPETHANPFYSCIFGPENTGCCFWSISKDSQFIFGGAFPMEHARERFEAQKKKLEARGFHFGEPLKTESCLVLLPSAFHDFAAGGTAYS